MVPSTLSCHFLGSPLRGSRKAVYPEGHWKAFTVQLPLCVKQPMSMPSMWLSAVFTSSFKSPNGAIDTVLSFSAFGGFAVPRPNLLQLRLLGHLLLQRGTFHWRGRSRRAPNLQEDPTCDKNWLFNDGGVLYIIFTFSTTIQGLQVLHYRPYGVLETFLTMLDPPSGSQQPV